MKKKKFELSPKTKKNIMRYSTAMFTTTMIVPTIVEVVPSPSMDAALEKAIGLGQKVEAASEFVAGDGTKANPYQITNAQQLSKIRENLNAHYILMNDIDLSGIRWEPIGTSSSNSFRGTFDGNGHVIKNLTINKPNTDFVGLFGYVGDGFRGAKIKDLVLENVNVVGKGYTGALAGYIGGNAEVTNVGVEGGKVTGNGDYVGGLVGYQGRNALISYAYATGKVSGNDNVGGLVGRQYDGTINHHVYATGEVSGNDRVGGLVGASGIDTLISYAYATGEVSGNDNVGGLVGYSDGTLNNAFALNPRITGTSNVGKAVGYGSSLNEVYVHEQIQGVGKTIHITGVIGESERKQFSTYGFDSNIWEFNSVIGLPVLKGLPNNIEAPVYESTITLMEDEEGLFIPIRDAAELDQVRYSLDETRYKLMNDIDLSGIEWEPIGTRSNSFRGTFDGNGHVIKNLTINKPNTDYVGLFGYVGGGEIKDLVLEDVDVVGKGYTGALAGYIEGNAEVTNVGVEGGKVTGNGDCVGGLVGYQNGSKINHAYATAEVSGNRSVGGLVGYLVGYQYSGTINHVYATGEVSGNDIHVGGLVGFQGSNTHISYAYATGEVSGNSNYVGGLVGYQVSGGTLNNAFALNPRITGTSSVGKAVGYGSGISHVYIYEGMLGMPGMTRDNDYTGVYTKEELLQRATYENHGFDFNIWSMDEGESLPYFTFGRSKVIFDGDWFYPYVPPELPVAPTLEVVDQTTHSITLSWEAVDGADEYILERRKKPNMLMAALSFIPFNMNSDGFEEVYRGNGNEFTDTGLMRGTRYEYRIRAVNQAGESELATKEAFTYQIVTFHWFPVKDKDGNEAVEYIVEKNGQEIGRTSNTFYTDDRAVPGEMNLYRAIPVFDDGTMADPIEFDDIEIPEGEEDVQLDPPNEPEPTEPEQPEEENPEDPEQPEDPQDPQEPVDPEQPEEPDHPEEPTDPELPDDEQEDPEDPEQPEQPEQPKDPEDPQEPEDPKDEKDPQPETPKPDRPKDDPKDDPSNDNIGDPTNPPNHVDPPVDPEEELPPPTEPGLEIGSNFMRIAWYAIDGAALYKIFRDGVLVHEEPHVAGKEIYSWIDEPIDATKVHHYEIIPIAGDGSEMDDDKIDFIVVPKPTFETMVDKDGKILGDLTQVPNGTVIAEPLVDELYLHLSYYDEEGFVTEYNLDDGTGWHELDGAIHITENGSVFVRTRHVETDQVSPYAHLIFENLTGNNGEEEAGDGDDENNGGDNGSGDNGNHDGDQGSGGEEGTGNDGDDAPGEGEQDLTEITVTLLDGPRPDRKGVKLEGAKAPVAITIRNKDTGYEETKTTQNTAWFFNLEDGEYDVIIHDTVVATFIIGDPKVEAPEPEVPDVEVELLDGPRKDRKGVKLLNVKENMKVSLYREGELVEEKMTSGYTAWFFNLSSGEYDVVINGKTVASFTIDLNGGDGSENKELSIELLDINIPDRRGVKLVNATGEMSVSLYRDGELHEEKMTIHRVVWFFELPAGTYEVVIDGKVFDTFTIEEKEVIEPVEEAKIVINILTGKHGKGIQVSGNAKAVELQRVGDEEIERLVSTVYSGVAWFFNLEDGEYRIFIDGEEQEEILVIGGEADVDEPEVTLFTGEILTGNRYNYKAVRITNYVKGMELTLLHDGEEYETVTLSTHTKWFYNLPDGEYEVYANGHPVITNDGEPLTFKVEKE